MQVSDEIHSGALFACLKFSLDGSLLLAVAEGRIYLLDSFEGELRQKVRLLLTLRQQGEPLIHSRPIPLLLLPIHTYTPALMQIINPGVGEGGQALEACLTPDARYVLSGSPDRCIRAWSVASGQEVARWEGHAGVPACLKVRGGVCCGLLEGWVLGWGGAAVVGGW